MRTPMKPSTNDPKQPSHSGFRDVRGSFSWHPYPGLL